MGRKKKTVKQREFVPGSQYHTIYNHILLNPGKNTYDIAKDLEPLLHMDATNVGKRCSNLAKRGLIKRKIITKRLPKGRYVSDTYWFPTELAPDDAVGAGVEEHLWRPDVSETIMKRHEINCFKVEELCKIFNHRRFKGNDVGSARDLAKRELKIIDSVYDTVFQVDVDMTIRMTYYPVLDTLEDEYEFVFECYFMTKKIGHLIKVVFDPDRVMFWFHYNNKIIGIRFNSLSFASSQWYRLSKLLAHRYNKALEEDLYSLDDLDL